MNEWQIFEKADFAAVKQIDKNRSSDYVGFVYILEWGDNTVKIGCTKQPYHRLRTLQKQAENYGNVKLGGFALSPEHTNYAENERKAHEYFSKYRKNGTELFDLSTQQAITEISDCLKLDYLDKSEALKQRAGKAVEMVKQLWRGWL